MMRRSPQTFQLGNILSLIVLVALIGWRCLWLAAVVPDTTHWADTAARASRQDPTGSLGPEHHAVEQRAVEHPESRRISFAPWEKSPERAGSPLSLRFVGGDVWDDDLPVWITPGGDREPGWATWDDNGNGEVDDAGELGAAWSDDFCIVALPGDPTPAGRILDRGGFRPQSPGDGNLSGDQAIVRRRFIVSE